MNVSVCWAWAWSWKLTKFSIKVFFSKCDHIYWRNSSCKTSFLCSVLFGISTDLIRFSEMFATFFSILWKSFNWITYYVMLSGIGDLLRAYSLICWFAQISRNNTGWARQIFKESSEHGSSLAIACPINDHLQLYI